MTLSWNKLVQVCLLTLTALSPITHSNPLNNDSPFDECPSKYGNVFPVVIMSIDGFRSDYMTRGLTPTIQRLAERGVTAPHMVSSYPTLTFPNHYTMVTGTYPEHHGIIANTFYDPVFHHKFSYTSETTTEGKWWGAEPIWNTVTNQGKISATFYWPGTDADIGGKHPSYYRPYNESISFKDRVDQVVDWLMMPVETRPSWISIYISEPDHTGHGDGPESAMENAELIRADLTLQHLLDGIAEAGLTSCVNVLVVSDHGMAPSGPEYTINLSEYIPDLHERSFLSPGAFPRIDPKNDSAEVKQEMMENLSCQRSEMRVFAFEDLPTRFHFSNNRRIEPIVLDLNPGYTGDRDYSFYLNGDHGYDYYYSLMNALFIAYGPAFKQGLEVEPFHNIELYNLMCLLAGVEPAPNNGTEGALYHLLVNPPEYPVLPKEDPPPTSEFPEDDLQPLLGMSGCEGDLQYPEEWLQSLNLAPSEEESLRAYHLPWGIPLSGDLPAHLTLLHHIDHVTAYSNALHMPLWSSFSMDGIPKGSLRAQWSSDVRLTAESTITCRDYEHLQENVTMQPLFPPAMSQDALLERVPYLVSNAVPMNTQQLHRWDWLMSTLVPKWLLTQGPINVVVGPLFDNNADSHVDDLLEFGIPEVPSDMFAVVTRCVYPVTSIDLCPPDSLDALTFIFPLHNSVSNCLDDMSYTLKFSAKVHDAELATGLTFYPDLTFRDRARVTLRISPELWSFD